MTSPRLPSFICLLLTLTTTFSFFTTAQADNSDDNDSYKPPPNMENMFGNQNQVCPTYSCPKPYVPINKWPLSIVSTGCQSTGGMGMMLGGKSSYKHIEQCCHLKNACYQLCGSNKQTCDAEMEKCMEKNCEELPDSADELEFMAEEDVTTEQEECTKMKSIVSMMGNMGGCNEYDGHQARVCECVPKEKVEDKMERVFRMFYKKFNSEGMGKVKPLVEKTQGKRAIFNKILYQLVKKYPAAIKKKEIEFPDPMKMDL